MAQLDDFSPLRAPRTLKYGSLTVLETIANLHTRTKLLPTTIMPKGF